MGVIHVHFRKSTRAIFAVITVAAVSLLCSAIPSFATTFRVDGVSKTIIYLGASVGDMNTNLVRENSTDFHLFVNSPTQWIARIHVNGFSWNPPPDYFEIGCDGTNTYEYASFESNAQLQATKTGRRPVNTGISSAHPGTVGYSEHYDEATILWWAFLSGPLLEERARTGNQKLPLIFVGDQRLRYVPIETLSPWARRSEPPFVLESLDQVNDGGEYSWNDVDNGPFVMPPSRTKYSGDPGKGFTNIVYRVTGTREVAGMLLPVEFQLDLFVPQIRPSKDGTFSVFLGKSYRFTVTNIAPNVPIELTVPKITGIASVSDMRLVQDQPRIWKVTYMTTNGWLTPFAVKKLHEYKYELNYESTAAGRIAVPRAAASRTVRVLFFCLFGTLPIICLWLLSWRRQVVQTKQNK